MVVKTFKWLTEYRNIFTVFVLTVACMKGWITLNIQNFIGTLVAVSDTGIFMRSKIGQKISTVIEHTPHDPEIMGLDPAKY